MPQPDSTSKTIRQLDNPQLKELDYLENLDADSFSIVQRCTCKIKTMSKRTGIDTVTIGRNLFTVRQKLKHGQFGKWLKTEFDWSQKMAYRFLNVYDCFKFVNLTNLDIPLSAIYLLAEPSTPEEARQEALEIGAQGERISVRRAKRIVQRHKSPPITAVTPEVLPPPVASAQMSPQPYTTITMETSDISQQGLQIASQISNKSPSTPNEGEHGLSSFPPVKIQNIEIDESILRHNPLQEMEVRGAGLRVKFLSRSGDVAAWCQQQSSALAKRLVS